MHLSVTQLRVIYLPRVAHVEEQDIIPSHSFPRNKSSSLAAEPPKCSIEAVCCGGDMLCSSTLAFSPPSPAGPPAFRKVSRITAMVRAQPLQVQPGVPPSAPTSLCPSPSRVLGVAIPLAASVCLLLWSNPVDAGILSGFSGFESVPGPQLPRINFLEEWNEKNQKKYAEFDSRFKSSSVLKELLEKSKLNKERNQRELQDKYCLRGAEWGVGDCSTQGMTQEERDEFIATLKKRAGGD
ncbi:unnamed protein product [Musa hybrid cultivar]